LHLEGHTIPALQLQLCVYERVGTIVVDENFRLFEVGHGREWGIAILWLPDVVSDSVFTWNVKLCGGDDAHWTLRVRVVCDESLSGLESDCCVVLEQKGLGSDVAATQGVGWRVVAVAQSVLDMKFFYIDIPAVWISNANG
jgi:hypothetical protein